MKSVLLKLYDYMAAHKIVSASSFVIITVLLVLSFLRLGYKEDISDFLPVDNDRQAALKVYQDISGANKVFAIVECTDTANIDYDCMVAAVDEFVAHLQENDTLGYVKDLTYNIDESQVADIIDYVYSNIPFFLTQDDYQSIESAVNTPDFVANRLEQAKQLLMLPTGGMLTNNLQRDPLNIFTPAVSALSKSSPDIGIDSYEGYILTPDSKRMIVMMTSPFGNSETDRNSDLVAMLNNAKDATIANNPSVYVRVTGGPVIAVGNSSQIKTDSIISILLAVVLILALLFYCFRNLRNILLIVISISWGWLFAIAGLAIVHDKISIIVIGISSVILGIAVNYPLHLIAHLSHTTTIKSALKEIITPLLIGNITTVCAFCTLIPLESNALSDLGLFSALLLIGTILFVIIYLPHIVKKKSGAEHEDNAQNDMLSKISNRSIKNNKYVFVAIIIVTLVLGFFSGKTSFDSNMSNINYMDDEQRENMAYFQELTQGIDNTEQNIYVVSRDTTFDGALAQSNNIAKSIEQTIAQDSSIRHSGCSRFVVSQQEQAKRIARWNAFIGTHGDALVKELDSQAAIAGFSADAFDEFKAILTQEYDYQLDLATLMPIFQSNFSCDSLSGTYNVVDVVSVPRCKTDSVEAVLKANCPQQYCFNIQALNSAMSKNLSDNFGYIGWACGILVFVFLWISFGRLELALLAFCPMAISWTWILGLMGLFDIQFNIVNVILATFIFGQGDDYTIFITEGCMHEYAYRKKMLGSYRRSIIISALIMFIGIGALIFAKHPALYSLAQVTIIGMLSVVFTSFIVPPMIFKWFTMRHGQYRKRPVRISAALRIAYCAIIWVAQLIVAYIIASIMYICGCRSLKSKEWFHKIVSRTQHLDLNIIPGVKLTVKNESNEKFDKPCVIVCNHQSMLDPAYLLALNHKILIVGNERSSLHPMINSIFKWLNFYTVRKDNHTDWVDSCFERDMNIFREYINAGYSIAVFPEGVRNPQSNIVRYHKGPFYLAQALGVDILPIFIHGLNNVMPMGSYEMNAGPMTMVIKERISHDNPLWSDDYKTTTKNIHHYYIDEYKKLAKTLETPAYFETLVKNRYLYKGVTIYSTVCKHLKQNGNYADVINQIAAHSQIVVQNCGYGEFPLMLSLTNPDIKVFAHDSDASNLDVAKSSADQLVKNLEFVDTVNLADYPDALVITLDDNATVLFENN